MMETDSKGPKWYSLVSMLSRPSRQTVIKLVLITLGYLVLARMGWYFDIHPENFAAVWPASGYGLAVLLLNHQRDWPRIVLAIFVAVIIANALNGFTSAMSLAFAGANVAEALLAAWILLRYHHGKPIRFTRIGEVVALIVGAVILSNSITALLGAAVTHVSHHAAHSRFYSTGNVREYQVVVNIVVYS